MKQLIDGKDFQEKESRIYFFVGNMGAELSTEILSFKLKKWKSFFTITKLFFNFYKNLHAYKFYQKKRFIDWQSFTPDINAIENI